MEYYEKPSRRLFIAACILRTVFFITTYLLFSYFSSAQSISAGTREGTAVSDNNRIVLHYFKTSRLNNKSILEWETAEEEDRGTIIIEKSNNSIQWDKIATITTYTSDVTKRYRYEDVMTDPVKYYYRLRITPENGYTYYSDKKTIDNRIAENFSLYPNPSESTLNLKNIGRGSSVTITNTYGQIVHPSIIRASGEDRQYNLQQIQKGIYYVYVNGIAFPFQKN